MHWLVREITGRMTRRLTRIWFRRFESATRRVREVQQRVLLDKLRRHQWSNFGLAHRFDRIRSLHDFRRHVPIADYSYYAPYIDRVKSGEFAAMFGPKTKVRMFAMTSGTTAAPKFVPVTDEFLKEYRFGWMLWGIRCYDMHYEIYRLKVFQLSGDWMQSSTEAGIPCGSISGLTMQSQCKIVRERYCVPAPLMKVHDTHAKYYAALRYSLPWQVGMAMAANPSTLIHVARLGDAEKELLLRDLADGTLSSRFDVPNDVRQQLQPLTRQKHPRRVQELEQIIAQTGHLYPKNYWPRMQVLSNWCGGSMGAYLRRYPEYWGAVPVRDIGLIASEGRMSIPLEDGTTGGVLDILHQFFEFIPESEIASESPTVLAAHELEEGEQYYILLTTSSGLYRYNIFDVVRCVGYYNSTPIIEFLNKGSHYSSVAGEKLSEVQVCRAVEQSIAKLDICLSGFTLAPCWSDPPYYSLLVEAGDIPDSRIEAELAGEVDRHLCAQNLEYESKRRSFRLRPVTLSVLPSGTWDRFARDRIARRGGSTEQYKHPCLSSDLEFRKQFQVLREIGDSSVAMGRKLA
jgi:hypothetical protein